MATIQTFPPPTFRRNSTVKQFYQSLVQAWAGSPDSHVDRLELDQGQFEREHQKQKRSQSVVEMTHHGITARAQFFKNEIQRICYSKPVSYNGKPYQVESCSLPYSGDYNNRNDYSVAVYTADKTLVANLNVDWFLISRHTSNAIAFANALLASAVIASSCHKVEYKTVQYLDSIPIDQGSGTIVMISLLPVCVD